jgi:hypothetical protein
MPLSELELTMIDRVVNQFITEGMLTTRKDLVVEFRSPDSVDRLVSWSLFRVIGSDKNLAPLVLAFHYCRNTDAQTRAKSSVRIVLRTLQQLYGVVPARKQVSLSEILEHAKNFVSHLTMDVIRLGLYLVEEFPVLESYGSTGQTPHPGKIPQIEWVSISERVVTINVDTAWDECIRKKREQFERLEAKRPPLEPRTFSHGIDAEVSGLPSGIQMSESSIPPDSLPASESSEVAGTQLPDPAGEVAGEAAVASPRIEAAMRALSDKPSDVDLLEFSDYAKALVDLIRSPKTQTPLTISIDGAWGSGKTTLMRLMQERLKGSDGKNTKEPRAHTVFFNAWKYDKEESLWAALALEILSQVKKDLKSLERVRLWFRLNWKRFDKWNFFKGLAKSFLLPAAGIAVAMLCAWTWSHWASVVVDYWKWFALSFDAGLIGFITLVTRKIYDQVIQPFELNISEYVRTPDYKKRVGFLHEFETDFKCVVSAVTKCGKSSLIVFIDDLDRCGPAKPVEVVEAVNHLLDADYCVFVMGMDARSVAASVQAKYKHVKGDDFPIGSGNFAYGYQFLEKIIQIPFRLPKASATLLAKFVENNLQLASPKNTAEKSGRVAEAEKLIASLAEGGRGLKESTSLVQGNRPDIPADVLNEASQNLFARTFDDDAEIKKAICEAIPFLELNARKIKRFINLFRLNVLIANRRGLLENGSIEISRLAKWLTIAVRWPDFTELATNGDFLGTLFEASGIQARIMRNPNDVNMEREQKSLNVLLKNPLVSRFVVAEHLLDLLKDFVGKQYSLNDVPKFVPPYVELSGTVLASKAVN